MIQVYNEWLTTSKGEPRGYIEATSIDELWFHTGTNCNLRCPFCLEGSMPGNNRIQMISAAECEVFIKEALDLGIQQFSFTGGEPFVNPDMPKILTLALAHRPCLVLTNGTEPLINSWDALLQLQKLPNPLSFRVSIDHPDPKQHDAGRGRGNFALAMRTIARLHRAGFQVSIARLAAHNEDYNAANAAYLPHLEQYGAPTDIRFVAFPDFLPPESSADVPEITENCMTQYLSAQERNAFMCAFSRMVVKKNDRTGVYACTLVDDDSDYDLAPTIGESISKRIMMRHHRCYSCFSSGTSCSER